MEKLTVSVIGFTGEKGSGKSICAKHLAKISLCYIYPFAFGIKKVLNALGVSYYEIDLQKTTDNKQPRLGNLSIRQFMQKFGTDFCRDQIDQDFWVNNWKMDVEGVGIPILVDDVRFLNEAEIIRKMGGIVIKVVNPRLKNNDLHRSETELQQIRCDFGLVNDGSLADLTKNLERMLRQTSLMVEE